MIVKLIQALVSLSAGILAGLEYGVEAGFLAFISFELFAIHLYMEDNE